MEWFVKAFVRASLTWLALGVTLGVAMAAQPVWIVYRPAHLHLNMLGFVTMMIYGVAYHVIPRFSGAPLFSRRLAGWHWWMANAGLLLMVAAFMLRPTFGGAVTPLLVGGGVLSAAGAYAFAYGLWRTLDGPSAKRQATERASAPARTPLPVAGS